MYNLEQQFVEHDFSRKDTLTGLVSKNAIIRKMDNFISSSGNQFTIAVIDVDNIKLINEAYGYSAGDRVLKDIGQVIKKNIRDCDCAGRYGGNQFILMFPGKTISQIESALGRLLKAIGTIRIREGLAVSVSMGVTEYNNNSLQDMLKKVDTYLQLTKKNDKHKAYAYN